MKFACVCYFEENQYLIEEIENNYYQASFYKTNHEKIIIGVENNINLLKKLSQKFFVKKDIDYKIKDHLKCINHLLRKLDGE